MKTLPFVDGPRHWKQSRSRDKWTRKQSRAYRMRKQEIEAGNVRPNGQGGYGNKNSEPCVPIVDASGHTYIVPQSVADSLMNKEAT